MRDAHSEEYRIVIDRMNVWIAALEARQLADLTFQEVSRSLRALSSTYVERRTKLQEGAALSGAGKRAAFALFYGPLHFLVVHHVVSALGARFMSVDRLIDLGGVVAELSPETKTRLDFVMPPTWSSQDFGPLFGVRTSLLDLTFQKQALTVGTGCIVGLPDP